MGKQRVDNFNQRTKWFELNDPWCPLFGMLPLKFLGEYHRESLAWACVKVIEEARELWAIPKGWTALEFGCKAKIFSKPWPDSKDLPWYPSDWLAEARKIFIKHEPIYDEAMRQPIGGYQMWYHCEKDYSLDDCYEFIIKGARSTVGEWTVDDSIKDFAILALYSLTDAWYILKDLLLGEESKADPRTQAHVRDILALVRRASEMERNDRIEAEKERIIQHAKKIGSVTKKNPGILAAVEEAYKKRKFKSAQALWNYLNNNYCHGEENDHEFTCSIGGKSFRVFFDRNDSKLTCVASWKKGDREFSKDVRIGLSAFKNYVSKVKQNNG